MAPQAGHTILVAFNLYALPLIRQTHLCRRSDRSDVHWGCTNRQTYRSGRGFGDRSACRQGLADMRDAGRDNASRGRKDLRFRHFGLVGDHGFAGRGALAQNLHAERHRCRGHQDQSSRSPRTRSGRKPAPRSGTRGALRLCDDRVRCRRILRRLFGAPFVYLGGPGIVTSPRQLV